MTYFGFACSIKPGVILSIGLFSLLFFGLNAHGQTPISFDGIEQAGFLKNSGQVRDLHNNHVESVYYSANLGGQQVFLTRNGLSLLFARPKKISWMGRGEHARLPQSTPSRTDSLCVVDYELERIDILLQDAVIDPRAISIVHMPGSPIFNLYFDSNAKGESLSLEKELLVKNVYPGIDWRLQIKQEKNKKPFLKYDFIVHPGANPSRIRIRYSDNAKLELKEGAINALTKMGTIHEEKPYSYSLEDSLEVSTAFLLKKNEIRFHIASFDKQKTLVIDPSIFWLTYISSSNNVIPLQSIFGRDVATDSAGNIYVQLSAAGNVPFPTLNPGGGAYYQNSTSSPNGSMIITKFAPGGQILWSTYFGNWVAGSLMTVDRSGNVIALGNALDGTPSFPNPNPVIPLLNNGGFYRNTPKKYFITKFSGSGALVWSSWYLHVNSIPTDITSDINGNVFVVGSSENYDFPTVNPGGGAYAVTSPQFGWAQVFFISQFNSSNQLVWSTRIEGKDDDLGAQVCTDKLGNIYLTGHRRSLNYPFVNAGGYFDTLSSSVLTRFNSAGQMTWSTSYPGSSSSKDLTTDDSCNLYIVCGKNIIKFNPSTNLVYIKSVVTSKDHEWSRIQYDSYYDQLQLLGTMSDSYFGFPTLNSSCNSSFYYDGSLPRRFNNITGPLFGTINRNGDFSYRSLVDWVYEYYDNSQMTIDPKGNAIYLFRDNRNANFVSNPQLTNPGNGAYYNAQCCNTAFSALLLKLTPSELSVNTETIVGNGCQCNSSILARPTCGQSPFSYQWSTGDTTAAITGLCPGNYWVRVTDANNMTKIIYVNLPRPLGSILSVNKLIRPENCNRSNGSLKIQNVEGGTAPYTYSLDGVNFTPLDLFSGLDSGLYVLTVKDINGCSLSDSIYIGRVEGPRDFSRTIINSSCIESDGQLQVSAVQGGIGPYQFVLNGVGSNSSGVFTGLQAATYQLSIVDTAGCIITDSVVIRLSTPPDSASLTIGPDHCNKNIGFIQVDNVYGGIAPYRFSTDRLNFQTGPIKGLADSSYMLYIMDAKGCILQLPFTIDSAQGPDSLSLLVMHALCGKQTGEVSISKVNGGAEPFSFAVDNNGYSSNTIFSGISPGLHQMVVKDSFGCIYSRDFLVDYKPMAIVSVLPKDTTVCYGQEVIYSFKSNISNPGTITWNLPSQANTVKIHVNSEMKVIMTLNDHNNCVIKDTATVRVKACNIPSKCVAIPNAFTPNHDGINETFSPIINGCIVNAINFQIFNRWGTRIFSSDRPNQGWDGKYKGVMQDTGFFVYLCTYEAGGEHISLHGTFLLIR